MPASTASSLHALMLGAVLVCGVQTAYSAPPDVVAPRDTFAQGTTILFQGDSITDGNRGRTPDKNHILGHGYVFLLGAKYGSTFPERQLQFLNRGISGNTVIDLKRRWQTDTLDLKPDVLSILIGVNDRHSIPLDQYEQTYDALLTATKQANPKVRLVLCEPFLLPVGPVKKDWEAASADMHDRQKIVARLAAKHGAVLVPFQSALDDACQRAPAEYWCWDGVHPTYSGHQLLADAWMRAVQTPSTGVAAGPLRRQVLAADDGKRTIALVDADGKMLWKYAGGPFHDAQLLPNGNVLLQTNYQILLEVDRDGKIVWKYDAKSNGNGQRPVEVHAFQRLSDGSTMIAESGPARIIEVDRDGTIQRQIKLHVDHPNAHRDTRLVRKLDNGNYLVAHEGDGVVREYNPDGDVVWEFAVPMFGKPAKGGHGPESFGNAVFSAVRLPNGNTLIGTGNGHSVLEVNHSKQIVWKLEQDDLPGIQLAWVTTLQPLANGNVIIGNCHAGPKNPQIIEVTRDKKIVWTFRNFEIFGDATPVAIVLDDQGRPLK